MAKPNLRIFFILDGSGSMSSVQDDVVGGLNAFIDDQKELDDGDTFFTLTVFDTTTRQVYASEPITKVDHVTRQSTLKGGGTALLDAIGETLTEAEGSAGPKDKFLVVIYTDGQENSSRKFTNSAIKEMVSRLENEGWSFIFMSADVDNFSLATDIGMAKAYVATMGGAATHDSFAATTQSTRNYRMSGYSPQTVSAHAHSHNISEAEKDRKKKIIPINSDPGDEHTEV